MTEITRLKQDVNGNSRHAVHFLDLEPDALREVLQRMTLTERYAQVVKLSNALGGRRYHNKSYGGGVAFQAQEHEMPRIIERVRAMVTLVMKEK